MRRVKTKNVSRESHARREKGQSSEGRVLNDRIQIRTGSRGGKESNISEGGVEWGERAREAK